MVSCCLDICWLMCICFMEIHLVWWLFGRGMGSMWYRFQVKWCGCGFGLRMLICIRIVSSWCERGYCVNCRIMLVVIWVIDSSIRIDDG